MRFSLRSYFTSVKLRMCKIGSTWRWTDLSTLSRSRWSTSAGLLLFWAKGRRVSSRVGFHGLSFRSREWCYPCRICKSFWSIQTQLICCIGDLNWVFAGNWTLVLCERNQTLSRKILQWWIYSIACRLYYLSQNNGKRPSLKETEKKSVQPRTNWLSQCCDCMVFLPLTLL